MVLQSSGIAPFLVMFGRRKSRVGIITRWSLRTLLHPRPSLVLQDQGRATVTPSSPTVPARTPLCPPPRACPLASHRTARQAGGGLGTGQPVFQQT